MLGAAAATLGLAAALALDLLELRARLDLRPPGLVVEEVATSTIAPVITLRGVVADWTLSEVHVGSVPLDMAALRSRDGAFEHPLALPALGPHRITVRARDRAGHETVVEHTVERRPIDLQLRVDAPAQGSWVSSSTVVAGTVSARGVPAAELLVSLAGRTVVPAPDGTFSAAVSLPAGEQTVELTARGRLTEVVTRRAVRVDPTAPVLRLAYRADPLLLGPDLVTPTETLVLEGLVEDGAGAARLLVNDVPGDVVAGEPFLREVPLGHALTRLVIVAEDPAGNRTPAVELQALRLPRPARSTTEGISGTLSGDGLIEAEAGPATYRIEVPAGAARLVVHVVGRPGPDVDLYLRHGATMASWAEAEHVAAADAIRQEVLLVDGTTDPPLRPGDYYLDIATRGAGRLAVAVRFDLPADDPLVVAGRAIERLARGAPDEALSALDVPPARDPARAAAFHLLRGFVQEARGDMAAAEAECTDGLSLAPRSWSLRFRRAKAREMQDRLDEALEDARAALGLDPPPAGGARLHTFRGELFHWRREYEAAIDEFIAAARLLPGEPTYHENLANSRRLAGQLEAAIADYTAALERQPGRASALNGRGLAHYSRSDLEPALTDFTAAAAAAPENAVYRTNRGIVLARKGDLAGAVRTFDEVLAAVADHVPALIERGRAHARLEQVARATADFEAALRLEPRNVEALVARGNLRHDAKQYAAAIDDYSVAIEVAPEDPVLWSNRGNSRRLLGDHDGALTDYQRSLELDPDAADAHFGRGRSAIAKGDYATAIAALERAVELDASSYVTHSWLGWALYLNGAHGDALRCYDEAVRLAPSDAVIHYERGQVRYARRDYTGAHEDFSRAIALDSSSPYFYDWRGAARRELGKAAEAIADFDAAIQRDGKFAQAYLNRGCMHYRAGAYSRAQADFETVLRLEPRRATAHNWLGNVFHSQTQYTQAIECYSRAIEIDGRDPVYFSNRGYSRHLAGDHRRALLDFTRAIELDSAYASAYERRALAYRALNDVAKAEQDERKGRELKR